VIGSSPDSPVEGNGFEISVPRQIGSGFNASVGLRSIERRRRGIIRAVVGLGKPIELFRGAQGAPLTAEMKAPTLLAVARGIAELKFRIHFPPPEGPCLTQTRPLQVERCLAR